MKNINDKQKNIDPIAEAKKSKYFNQYLEEAKQRIKLGVEVYNTRKLLGMNQQELAKRAHTTQRIISRIENGDVNIGFSLLNRIANVLNFDYKNWSNILEFNLPVQILFVSKAKNIIIDNKKKNLSNIPYKLIK